MAVIGLQLFCAVVAQGIENPLEFGQGLADRPVVEQVDLIPDLFHFSQLQGMLGPETELFQHVDTVVGVCLFGHGNQYFPGVFCLGHALFLFYAGKSGEIVDPVGNLHIESADIHLVLQTGIGECVELLFGKLFAVKIAVAECGHRVHDLRDSISEQIPDLGEGDIAVLHDIVQQGGHQVFAVKTLVGKNACHTEGVVDVGLPGSPLYAAVLLVRVLPGLFDPGAVSIRMFGNICIDKLAEADIQFVIIDHFNTSDSGLKAGGRVMSLWKKI